jgi:tetratricopeptide (TPR) repeat protein
LRTVRGKGKAETLREQGQVTRLGTARVVGAHIERLLRRGGFDEALASLNHTLGERPNDIRALVHKAAAFGLSGHHEEALEIYEKVCERYPEDSTASYQLGVASSTAVTVVSVPAITRMPAVVHLLEVGPHSVYH